MSTCLHVLPLSFIYFFIFNHQTNPAAATWRKYIRDLVLGWTLKFTHTFCQPSPKFFRDHKMRNFGSIFDISRTLTHRGFKMEDLIGDLILPAWATIIKFRLDSDISPISPLILTHGSNISKFDLIFTCETFQFLNKATPLKFETRVGSGNDCSISLPNLT